MYAAYTIENVGIKKTVETTYSLQWLKRIHFQSQTECVSNSTALVRGNTLRIRDTINKIYSRELFAVSYSLFDVAKDLKLILAEKLSTVFMTSGWFSVTFIKSISAWIYINTVLILNS